METAKLRRLGLGVVMVFGCRDAAGEGSEGTDGHGEGYTSGAPKDEDEDEDIFEETGFEPGPCGGNCEMFQSCVDGRCVDQPELPACDGTVQFELLDVELRGATDDLRCVQSGELSSGSGDALVFVDPWVINVLASDPDRPLVELPALGESAWVNAAIGEVTGDANPDLLALTNLGQLVVFGGDEEGGLSLVQELDLLQAPLSLASPFAIGNLGYDGIDEVFVEVGTEVRWLVSEGGLLQDQGSLGRTNGSIGFRYADGKPELWIVEFNRVLVRHGTGLDEVQLDLPFLVDPSAVVKHARFSERADQSAAILTRYADGWMVAMADRVDDVHAIGAPNSAGWLAAADVDGDGFDDLILGGDRVVLGLDEGSAEDPFAGACAADIEGLHVWQLEFSNRPDDAFGIVGWDHSGSAHAYAIVSTP